MLIDYLRAILTDGMRPQADNDGWLNYLPSALTTLRTVTLLSTSFLCAAVACLGGTLLFYILLSRIFSPAAAHHERSLYFDYTKADAIATAHFLPESQYNRAYNSEVSTVSLMGALSRMASIRVSQQKTLGNCLTCRQQHHKRGFCPQDNDLMCGWSLQPPRHMDRREMRSFR